MGWDYHHEVAPYDRRSICRRQIGNGHEVVRDAVVGTTYYAAVRSPHDGSVYAAIILTHIDRSDYCNFGMKFMDEECGPYESRCPESVLRKLSPTDNQYALEWRERCRAFKDERKPMFDAPIGTRLKVVLKSGQERIVYKREPNFQFKTWWLQVEGILTYVPKNRVAKAELI